MNLAKIKLMGLRAFELGLSSTPTANQAFVNSLSDELRKVSGLKEQARVSRHMANAYVAGWMVASIAKGATPDRPSVKLYKEIIENPDAH